MAHDKNDSCDGDEESDDDNEIVLRNKYYQKSIIFDDNDDDNDSDQQNAANTKTSAEVIAGTNMNDTPTTNGEISKDMTVEQFVRPTKEGNAIMTGIGSRQNPHTP